MWELQQVQVRERTVFTYPHTSWKRACAKAVGFNAKLFFPGECRFLFCFCFLHGTEPLQNIYASLTSAQAAFYGQYEEVFQLYDLKLLRSFIRSKNTTVFKIAKKTLICLASHLTAVTLTPFPAVCEKVENRNIYFHPLYILKGLLHQMLGG